jgi:hypothetical protein
MPVVEYPCVDERARFVRFELGDGISGHDHP